MEEKQNAHEVAEQSKFLRWLDNFWFHYKWQTIAVLLVVILLAVTLPQCARGESGGVTVTFAGGYVMSNDEQTGLKNVLSAADENARITLSQYSILTEEEITANNTYTDPETGEKKLDTVGRNLDRGYNQDRIRTLQSYLMTGDCGIWIVSPYVYENWFDGKIQIVENRRLGDLPIFEEYGVTHFLTGNCGDYRVILTRSVFGETAKDKSFEAVRAFYEKLTGTTGGD